MPTNSNRIQGTVVWFNGITGRAERDCGDLCKIHINSFRTEDRAKARDILREGSRIEFTAYKITTPTSTPYRAVDIKIIQCDPLPEPTGFEIGYWENVRGKRCSSCGYPHRDDHIWCPTCGAKMYSKDIYDMMLPRLIKPVMPESTNPDQPVTPSLARDLGVTVNRSDYPDPNTWAAICQIFGADPNTVQELNVSRAIVFAAGDN